MTPKELLLKNIELFSLWQLEAYPNFIQFNASISFNDGHNLLDQGFPLYEKDKTYEKGDFYLSKTNYNYRINCHGGKTTFEKISLFPDFIHTDAQLTQLHMLYTNEIGLTTYPEKLRVVDATYKTEEFYEAKKIITVNPFELMEYVFK